MLASGHVGLRAIELASDVAAEDLAFVGVDEDGNPDLVSIQATAQHATVMSVGRRVSASVPATLAALEVDILVLAWWPYIIRTPLLDAPRLGCLNFHPSLLPHNRGKDPNFWALAEQRPYGATIHWVSEGIDDGPIAFQTEVPSTWEDTGATLYAKGIAAMLGLFESSLPAIVAGDIPCVPQGDYGSSHNRAELDIKSLIDLDAPTTARDVLNLVRARTFPPHPAARFADDTGTFEVRVTISRVET